ncbi:MAG: hypothetical protein JST01_15525 [Cyanobacteria bacterium SZAS TMP-1]|nr:hypothetical protein [Cyanobacteria bacterium SZAS TMP-1]
MSEENLDEKGTAVQCVAVDSVSAESANAAPAPRDAKNSIAMSIVAGGMEFKLDTVVDPSSEAVQLNAKLELALTLLSLSENRLAEAMRQIGQLQERLMQMQTQKHMERPA